LLASGHWCFCCFIHQAVPVFLTAFPFVGGSCSGGGVGAKVGNAGIRLLCLFNLAPILANNHQMRHAFGFLKELVSFSIAKLF